MTALKQLSKDYYRVETALRFMEDNFIRQPELNEIAGSAGLSEYHFQRLFSRWVGISPKRFLQYVTKEHAKKLLEEPRPLMDVAWDAGLSGAGRLHDLFVTCEAVTPGEYRGRGEGTAIAYGIHPSPFGDCLVATTERGLCAITFVQGGRKDDPVSDLKRQWSNAPLTHAPKNTRLLAEKIFDFSREDSPAPLHLYVQGTNFQIKVWEALLKIPLGAAVTYEDIARHIGMPKSARAVGNAAGKNPIPFLIPCHRVIRKMGDFGYYGGGPTRKKVMLGWEAVMKEHLSAK